MHFNIGRRKLSGDALAGDGPPSYRATKFSPSYRYNRFNAIDVVKIDDHSRFTFTKKVKNLFPVEPGDIIMVYKNRENGQVILDLQRRGNITASWIVKKTDDNGLVVVIMIIMRGCI